MARQVRIATVLRSGGEFTPQHVQALDRQLKQWAPLYEHICLSDVNVPGVNCEPLWYGWPKWWAKMELFRPDIDGDLLFMDLDTVIVGPLDDILKQRKLTLLRDFYRSRGLQSSFMLLPEAARSPVWEDFEASATVHMSHFFRGGDQAFLETHWLHMADRWQDAAPGQIVSWKATPAPEKINAHVVIFHGRPRPWDTEQFKDLY